MNTENQSSVVSRQSSGNSVIGRWSSATTVLPVHWSGAGYAASQRSNTFWESMSDSRLCHP